MNHHEHTLKMIYHGIYKLDLYTLKLIKKDNNKKEVIIPVFVDICEKKNLPIITIEEIKEIEEIKIQEIEEIKIQEIEIQEIEIPENKILFKGENNLITSDMIKTIYNIDINNTNSCSFSTHSSFFYRSITYKIYDDKVIIYYI
jgi:hypothetical protein